MRPWTAWADSGFDPVAVHESLQVLRGRQLVAVRYIDLDYGTTRPLWLEGDHDQVGHGIELDLDDGTTWSVVWEQRGYDEGLGVRREALIPVHVIEGGVWDVTRRWRRRGPAVRHVGEDLVVVDRGSTWRPARPATVVVPAARGVARGR